MQGRPATLDIQRFSPGQAKPTNKHRFLRLNIHSMEKIILDQCLISSTKKRRRLAVDSLMDLTSQLTISRWLMSLFFFFFFLIMRNLELWLRAISHRSNSSSIFKREWITICVVTLSVLQKLIYITTVYI